MATTPPWLEQDILWTPEENNASQSFDKVVEILDEDTEHASYEYYREFGENSFVALGYVSQDNCDNGCEVKVAVHMVTPDTNDTFKLYDYQTYYEQRTTSPDVTYAKLRQTIAETNDAVIPTYNKLVTLVKNWPQEQDKLELLRLLKNTAKQLPAQTSHETNDTIPKENLAEDILTGYEDFFPYQCQKYSSTTR